MSYLTSNPQSFLSSSQFKSPEDKEKSQVYSSFDLTPFTSEKKQ